MLPSKNSAFTQLAPHEALRRVCFARNVEQQQRQQQLMNAQNAQMMQQQPAEETKAKPTRKRTRKAPANPKGAKKGAAATASPAPPGAPGGGFVAPQGIPPQSMHYQGMPEVFVVGEPSMLGGEFREDERTIDKLENPNYDPNAAMRHPPAGTPGMMAPPQMQQGPGPATLQQMQHHQLLGGPSPQQGQQQPPPPHHLAMGAHGSMGPPMMPQQPQLQQVQQQQQGVGTPPGAGGMPNGLQPPPAGYEYLAQWPRQPTNHLNLIAQ